MAVPAVIAVAAKAKKIKQIADIVIEALPYIGIFLAAFIIAPAFLFYYMATAGETEAAAQAADAGYCIGPSSGYTPSAEQPNPSVVAIAYQVSYEKTQGLPDEQRKAVMLALFETLTVETGSPAGKDSLAFTGGFSNVASKKSPESISLPHDGEPRDGDLDSVGVLQQRTSWGTMEQRMTPAYAIGTFVDRAIAAYAQVPPGGNLAQKVQVSGHPARYPATATYAQAMIDRAASGSTLQANNGETTGSNGTTNSADARDAATSVIKPTIVLDPGHSGTDTSRTDPATGLLDHDYPNTPEITEMFNVATSVKTQLESSGYTVIMTKNSVNDTVSHRQRADIATNANAALAVSIHDDHSQSWATFGQVYEQHVGNYRVKPDGTKVTFNLPDVAKKSEEYGQKITDARTAAEGRAVTQKVNSFDGREGIAAGNLSLVQLFTKAPWVYNEVGAKDITPAQLTSYATGLVNGIKAAVPPTAGATASSVNCNGGDATTGWTASGQVRTVVSHGKGDPAGGTTYNIVIPEGPAGVAINAALDELGIQYSWGGGNMTGPTKGITYAANTVGFDCSGLMEYAWGKAINRSIGGTTATQINNPKVADNDHQPGDLVFYAPGNLHHVAMYLGDGLIVAAPSTGDHVKVQSVNGPGKISSWNRPKS